MKKLYKQYIYWYWYWRDEYDADWMGKNLSEVYYWLVDKIAPLVLCLYIFHEPVDDHCGKPEHRYCWKCYTSTPNQKKQ